MYLKWLSVEIKSLNWLGCLWLSQNANVCLVTQQLLAYSATTELWFTEHIPGKTVSNPCLVLFRNIITLSFGRQTSSTVFEMSRTEMNLNQMMKCLRSPKIRNRERGVQIKRKMKPSAIWWCLKGVNYSTLSISFMTFSSFCVFSVQNKFQFLSFFTLMTAR